jgi:acyl-CoA reductase-like NAD-dependent aldehyde dehydrogenase
MKEQQFIIGGRWKKGASVLPVSAPFSGETLAMVHQAGPDDLQEAVTAARNAFHRTSQLAGYERAAILRNIAEGLKQSKEEFAHVICAEAGKPITAASAEVDRAVSTFTIASEEATRMNGTVIPLDVTPAGKGKRGIVERFPLGVILCITPFNFPLNLVAHKLAPAIAAGNSFILKPAPQTPLTALLLGELLLASGYVPEAVSILPTSNTLAQSLVEDPRIAMVSFTGSARVGWGLKASAGRKKVALELGGNAAAVIHADADLPAAAARCVAGAFGYAGQVCIKVQRILLHRSIADRFEEMFSAAVARLIVGDPSDPSTVVGPMISEHEAQRVETWVNEAVSSGATILAGGTRNGKFMQPTVLKGVTAEMKVCSEEIFGPVVTLEQYADSAEAVHMINASRYGLQAGLFTNDHAMIQTFFRELQVGGLIVNDVPTFRVDNMPYGGVKDSGIGREGVRYAMEEMSEPKLLVQ